MGTTTDILSAACTRLSSLAYSPAPAVIYPNRGTETPNTGLWLEASFFPNSPSDLAWDDNGPMDQRGFFQVVVGYRKDIGQQAPSELADAVIDHFPKGTTLGPVRVRQHPYQMPAVTRDGSRVYIAVTIPYQGITCYE